MLQGSQRHYIDGFMLTLHRETYLVEVVRSAQPEEGVEQGSLPDWVFDARRAIWLHARSGPIYNRAIEGEKIQKLLARRQNRKLKAAGH